MSAAFNDAAGFDDEDLLGTANGREAMGDDKCSAATHQVTQPFLNERFRFGVQTGSRFIENEDAWIGENGASDGDALLLPAGKFYTAFADDRIVFFFKRLYEFVDSGNTACFHDFFFAGIRPREGNIFANRTVEKKSVLQHNTKLRAIAPQLDGGEIHSIDQDAATFRFVESGDEPDDGGLPCTGRADQSSDRTGQRDKINVEENLLTGFVGKIHIFENDFTGDAVNDPVAGVILIFDFFVQDFTRALQAGDGFGKLRADGNNLENGSDEHRQECHVADQGAGRHVTGSDLLRTEKHDHRAYQAHQHHAR